MKAENKQQIREAIADTRNFVMAETADLKKLRFQVINEIQLIATLGERLKVLGATLDKLKEVGE